MPLLASIDPFLVRVSLFKASLSKPLYIFGYGIFKTMEHRGISSLTGLLVCPVFCLPLIYHLL